MKYFSIQVTNSENISFHVPFAHKNCQKEHAIKHAIRKGILDKRDKKLVSDLKEIGIHEYNRLIRC